MDINNFINSQFKIIDVFSESNCKKHYLVNELNNPDNSYCLYVYKITDLSEAKVTEIVTKLNTLSQLKQSENLSFPRVIKVFTEQDYLLFVHEYLEVETLSSEIENNRLWDQDTAVEEMRNLLENLTYLHSQNLIHQSIKPESISINNNKEDHKVIFNNYGQIIDSPSSNLMATITVQDRLYLPPEVIRGKTAFASDIYAVGILVINMLIGQKIIELEEDNEGNLIWQTEVNIEPSLVNIIKKMTFINIKKRYQNIEEVIQDINTYFPQQNNSKFLQSTAQGYTPTEIIGVNQPIQNSEKKPTLSQTEIAEPTPKEKSKINDIHSLPDTQISLYSNDDNGKVNYSNQQTNIPPIPSQNNLNDDYPFINNTEQPNRSPEPTKPAKNNYHKQKLSLKAGLAFGMMSRLKSPQAMIISSAIALILIFGAGIVKSHFHQKYITKISQELKGYYETDQFQQCLNLINSDQVQSLQIIETIEQEFVGKCWLGLAELEAIQGNYPEAIRKAVNVDRKSANYKDAKQKIEEWSEQIFREAEEVCRVQKNVALAEEIASNIPPISQWRKKVLDLMSTCGQEPQPKVKVYDLCEEIPLLCPD